jgi:SAM-dependent methyltransferase
MKNKIDKTVMKDIVEWDIINWSKAVKFWGKADIDYTNKKVLEIGSRNGGLSLYFALKGADVVCSDLNGPTEKAKELHLKYGMEEKIKYEAVDATNIEHTDYFDIICFKSVLGGIGYNDSKERQYAAIKQMYKSLKQGGYLLVCENLTASPLHKYFRKKFTNWGDRWRYVSVSEMLEMLDEFKDVSYKTIGFFATFGRSNSQRNILGYIDNIIENVILKKHRYIGTFTAKK